MSVEHGTLTLLPQARPTFQPTANGQLDTGYRRFQCYTSRMWGFLNGILKVGTSDFFSLRRAQGDNQVGYPSMIIASREIEEEESNHSIIGVRYEGLLDPNKGSSIIPKVVTEQQSAQIVIDGVPLNLPIRLEVPRPTVIHRWTTIRGRPSMGEAGGDKIPPGISTAELARIAQSSDFYTGDGIIRKQSWVLTARDFTSPGNIGVGRIWAVEDTYQFIVVRTPV